MIEPIVVPFIWLILFLFIVQRSANFELVFGCIFQPRVNVLTKATGSCSIRSYPRCLM